MKIYTKTGDRGQTSLLGGKRLSKDDLKIETYGTVDELNAFVGVLRDYCDNYEISTSLMNIQNKLFTIGSILAAEGDTDKYKIPEVNEDDILYLERLIDQMNESLEPMRNFIIPGGNKGASFAHVCRTICRRAERRTVTLLNNQDCHPLIVKYLNRLSDYFFVLSRFLTKLSGDNETLWNTKM